MYQLTVKKNPNELYKITYKKKKDSLHLISDQGMTAFKSSISSVSVLVQGSMSITASKVLEVKVESTQHDTLLQLLSR